MTAAIVVLVILVGLFAFMLYDAIHCACEHTQAATFDHAADEAVAVANDPFTPEEWAKMRARTAEVVELESWLRLPAVKR